MKSWFHKDKKMQITNLKNMLQFAKFQKVDSEYN